MVFPFYRVVLWSPMIEERMRDMIHAAYDLELVVQPFKGNISRHISTPGLSLQVISWLSPILQMTVTRNGNDFQPCWAEILTGLRHPLEITFFSLGSFSIILVADITSFHVRSGGASINDFYLLLAG